MPREAPCVAALAGARLGHDLLDRAAGHELDDDEGDRQHAEQRRDHQQQALEDVGEHRTSSACRYLLAAVGDGEASGLDPPRRDGPRATSRSAPSMVKYLGTVVGDAELVPVRDAFACRSTARAPGSSSTSRRDRARGGVAQLASVVASLHRGEQIIDRPCSSRRAKLLYPFSSAAALPKPAFSSATLGSVKSGSDRDHVEVERLEALAIQREVDGATLSLMPSLSRLRCQAYCGPAERVAGFEVLELEGLALGRCAARRRRRPSSRPPRAARAP